jgi:hypothetical protein
MLDKIKRAYTFPESMANLGMTVTNEVSLRRRVRAD